MSTLTRPMKVVSHFSDILSKLFFYISHLQKRIHAFELVLQTTACKNVFSEVKGNYNLHNENFLTLTQMPHNRLANFDLLLFTSLKFAKKANLQNLDDMIRLQSKWKSFVEMTNEELGNTEKIVRSNEAWYKLFDDADAGIHPEGGSFAQNYIRAGKIFVLP